MQKEVKFNVENITPDWSTSYSEDKYAVAKVCFLSTRENTHELNITEEVLKRDAHTILGSFLVAKMYAGDATSHMSDEIIFGYFPKEQEIIFEDIEENEQNITKAMAYAVISKQYSKDFYNIFVNDNLRNSSVEMKVSTPEDDETDVVSFDIYGLTCLGKTVNGSCSDANITMVRFSEGEAQNFFDKNKNSLSALKKFAEERRKEMAEDNYVSHPIDASKEALYDGEWDGEKAKQDLVKEKDFNTLAPKVCIKLEDGWKDREITKLGYPIMMLHEGKWVYSKKGLASALGYAKKENETAVVSKVEKIYKKLGLDSEGKEEDKKMSKEIEFAAVDIGDMWGKVWNVLRNHGDWRYGVEGIYEEDNKKFAVLRTEDGVLYRMDFSLTEDGMEASDELTEVKKEFTETDKVVKFAEPEDVEKYTKFEEDKPDDGKDKPDDDDGDEGKKEHEEKMSAEDMKVKMAEMQADIESRDNIIMEKDKELEELRKFKADIEDKEKTMAVETIMSDVKECFESSEYNTLRDEGLACKMSEIDGWSNKVKAMAFSAVKKPVKKNAATGVWSFSAPVTPQKTSKGLWD